MRAVGLWWPENVASAVAIGEARGSSAGFGHQAGGRRGGGASFPAVRQGVWCRVERHGCRGRGGWPSSGRGSGARPMGRRQGLDTACRDVGNSPLIHSGCLEGAGWAPEWGDRGTDRKASGQRLLPVCCSRCWTGSQTC